MMQQTLPLSDGAVARALVAGDSGPVVVLIHGVGLRAEAWADQIAALSPTHRVVAVDMPGHGGSTPLPPGAELPDFVAWAGRVIAALGGGPVAVAGHSMGALIAGGLAASRPDLVSTFAMLCPVFRRSEGARTAVLARAADIAAGRGDPLAPLGRWFDDTQSDLSLRVGGWLQTVSRDGYATAYAAFARGCSTYADAYGQIAAPALILTADGDANSTPDMTRALASTIPNARAVVITGHRHMVPMTAPDEVGACLQEWLAGWPATQKVPA